MSEIQITSINGMGAITDLGGGSFSTTGMEANDHMHISEDFIDNAGVVGADDYEVTQADTPGKKVTVAGGVGYVLNADYSATSLSEQRYWRAKMGGDTDVTITDNISGNPRIDIICIKVDPTATPDDEGNNVAELIAVEGTPAVSPTAPAVPDNHLKLAEVAVSNGFSSIVDADITDSRTNVYLNVNYDGWNKVTNTWTRTGDFAFTIAGNVTSVYRKGTKVRYKDGSSYEYGVIGSSVYSSPNTTITLITNSDYAMAAATITDTYLSYIDNPVGFPTSFNYVPAFVGFSGAPNGIYQWNSITPELIQIYIRMTDGTSNANTFTIGLPFAAVTLTNYLEVLSDVNSINNNATVDAASRTTAVISSAVTVVTLQLNASATGWTTSSGKRANFRMAYKI